MLKDSFIRRLILFFLVFSVFAYSIHYLIFRDSTFIFKYVIAQLGFLPINVLLVTIVLNGLMSSRAKSERMQKMNMLIGVFFSDVGTDLLRAFAKSDDASANLHQQLVLSSKWGEEDFNRVKTSVTKENYRIKVGRSDLLKLNAYLGEKHDYLLRLLENPNLMEHESFSKLLWAVFHLTEELSLRGDISALGEPDVAHLQGDVNRIYVNLITQWLDYIQHIKAEHPYIYSLALRTNPFNPEARVEVMAQQD